MSVYEINCATDEHTQRPLTAEERVTLAADRAVSAEDIKKQQWAEVDRVRNAQLTDTDYTIAPYTADMPAGTKLAFDTYANEWRSFRQQLRDLADTNGAPEGDPTAIVWPYLPYAPHIAITPPPPFVDYSHWHDDWTPK